MPVTINGTTGVVFPDGVTQGSGVPNASGTSGAPLVSNGTIYTQNTAVGAAFGGTGLTSPGTAGNVLTSNGSAWVSQAAAAFDAGTVMIFAQTSAPTGWTKLTNLNDYALRVVSGAASTGGSTAFSTVFANQTPTINVGGLSAGATTLSTSQIPSHNHSSPYSTQSGGCFFATGFGPIQVGPSGVGGTPNPTGSTGGGGSHTHSISGSATSSAITLNVQYVDVIRASKN